MITFPKSKKSKIHYLHSKEHLHHVLLELHFKHLFILLVTFHSPNNVLYLVSQLSVMQTRQRMQLFTFFTVDIIYSS